MTFVQHKTFTTAAEIQSNHAALRNKFFPTISKPIYKPAPSAIAIRELTKGRSWDDATDTFDHHVKLYRAMLERIAPKKPVRPSAAPLWKTFTINFNSHVIDYMRHVLACEDGNISFDPPKKPVDEIIGEVLRYFSDYGVDCIKSSRRGDDIMLPRHLSMYEAKRQRPDLSYPEIARRFCRKDHSGIIHAVRKIEAMRKAGKLDWFYGGGC